MKKLFACGFIVVVIIFILFEVKQHSFNSNILNNQNNAAILNRNEHLILTKHARCRMDCRHITEEEIKEILQSGTINYEKSNPTDKRGATYALEGYSKQHQHLRIVVDPESDGLVIVTCIDLDEEWQCDCN